MEQGLKERLIGAAVLVGLGVWLIPWVLDGSGPEEQTAAELELPAQEPLPMRTHTIDLNEPRQAPATTAAAVAPEHTARAEAEPAARPPAQTASAQAASGATPEGDAPAPSASAAAAAERAQTPAAEAAAAPSRDAAGASDRPAEPAAAVAKAEAEPEKTAAATRPAPAPRPAASGEWMVQLGSFGEEENAKRLAERVRTFGYRPDISNVRAGGRLMYRVRVGPHATRGQAEAAASSLSAHGFVAQVVAAE